MPTLLLILIFLPLGTAIAVALLGTGRGPAVRWLSLASTLVSLALALVLSIQFAIPRVEHPTSVAAPGPGLTFHPEMVTRWNLLPVEMTRAVAIQFYVGLDGLNVWLVLLTALLMVTCVLVSWTAITDRVNEFYAWLLALQMAMTGVFLSFDIILFYVFFELTLVPLFFLIGIWGGSQRQYAARKFFIYTLTGSLITLLGVLGVVLALADLPAEAGERAPQMTFAIPELVRGVDRLNRELPERLGQEQRILNEAKAGHDERGVDEATRAVQRAQERYDYWRRIQFWVFVALMCGFAIKVPLVPVHTWLPLAHVEAPTAGSVLLAGILLKVGTYGFLRLCLPLAPDASLHFGAPLIGSLAVVGVLYGAFCALAQDDIKKLVAYSSVSHLGLCMVGMFALNEVGLNGSMLQMINHGLSTGGLFLLVGMLYERYHTRKLIDYSGMGSRLHLLACFMVFITMSSIGLPGLNGFLGEVLVLMGMYDFSGLEVQGPLLSTLAAGGVVLGAWYMLTMVRRVFFGPLKEPHVHAEPGHGPVGDLNGRELAALLPVAAVCLALGVYPRPFFDTIRPEVQTIARIANDARDRSAALATAAANDRQLAAGKEDRTPE
jgi:NADH-quinone oxidoreductase subunit M